MHCGIQYDGFLCFQNFTASISSFKIQLELRGNYHHLELATLRLLQETKATFRENFSLLRVDPGKIFEITTFIRGPRATYCTNGSTLMKKKTNYFARCAGNFQLKKKKHALA